MSEVTRKDVIEWFKPLNSTHAPLNALIAEKWADALIAAFPHLVGKVEVTADDALPKMRAALEAVLELHARREPGVLDVLCSRGECAHVYDECPLVEADVCDECLGYEDQLVGYPCPTVRAIKSALTEGDDHE